MLKALISSSRLAATFRFISVRDAPLHNCQRQLSYSSILKSHADTSTSEQEQEVMVNDAEQLKLTKEILQKVDDQIKSNVYGRLFAVVFVNNRQHIITAEDLICFRSFEPSAGDKIRLEKVLAVGGKDFTLFGRPLLPKDLVNVEATVVEKTLESSVITVKYKSIKKPLKFRREVLTTVRVNKITIDHPLDNIPMVAGVEGRTF